MKTLALSLSFLMLALLISAHSAVAQSKPATHQPTEEEIQKVFLEMNNIMVERQRTMSVSTNEIRQALTQNKITELKDGSLLIESPRLELEVKDQGHLILGFHFEPYTMSALCALYGGRNYTWNEADQEVYVNSSNAIWFYTDDKQNFRAKRYVAPSDDISTAVVKQIVCN